MIIWQHEKLIKKECQACGKTSDTCGVWSSEDIIDDEQGCVDILFFFHNENERFIDLCSDCAAERAVEMGKKLKSKMDELLR